LSLGLGVLGGLVVLALDRISRSIRRLRHPLKATTKKRGGLDARTEAAEFEERASA